MALIVGIAALVAFVLDTFEAVRLDLVPAGLSLLTLYLLLGGNRG